MTSTETTSDTDLLRQMRSGTAAAFQTLYLRYQRPLYRYALLRCGSGDNAADIVQEVFMGLLLERYNFDPLRGSLPNFLFGVARNVALKMAPPHQQMASVPDEDEEDDGLPEIASDAAGPLAHMLNNLQAEQVRQALAHLAPHYRDVVILYEMHDLSYLEIAGICQIDIGTVRSRLSRARAALATRLARHRDNHHLRASPT